MEKRGVFFPSFCVLVFHPVYKRESRSFVQNPIDKTIKVKFFSITFNISGDCGFFLSSSIYSLASSTRFFKATMRSGWRKLCRCRGKALQQ